MLGRNLVETIMGGFVLIVAAIFLAFAYLFSNLSPAGGYTVKAAFGSVDGLTNGADVRIGGVKVGVVTREIVDPKDYRAIVFMNVNPDVRLPTDTKAVVASAGLLGGKYIKLEPGHSSDLIKAGGEITNTEGAVVLEELLGKIIFLATDQGTGQGQGQPGQGAGQPPAAGPGPRPGQGQGPGGAAPNIK